ncbi:MAG: MFS transporter [Promethearchaeota archaeon]|nr:MAG: MFS transporter [Candidatus Lokiarchaeota archaeon]
MEKLETRVTLEKLPKKVKRTAIIVGIIFAGATIFGYYEASFFNTYLDHVLNLEYYYISIMVSLSAIMGLIWMIIWGIKSDNTRTRLGRRRPYLLSGFIAGIAMVTFAFAEDFLMCLILDVIIIGIASNAFYTAQRALIPDLVETEHRGRANGIVNVFSNIGLLTAISLTLIANEIFTVKRGTGNIITREGHLFLFLIGGGAIILCGMVGFLLLKELPPSQLPPKNKFRYELKEIFNLEEFKKQNQFFRIVLAQTIYKAHIYVVLPFLFVYLFSLAMTTLEFLIIIVVSTPIMIVAMISLGKIADKFGRKHSVAPAIIIASIGFFIMPTALFYPQYKVLILLIAMPLVLIGLLGMEVPLGAWSQDLLPEDRRGKFLGILNVVNTISQIIGVTVGGIIATIYGLVWVFAFAPIFSIGSILFFRRVQETLVYND